MTRVFILPQRRMLLHRRVLPHRRILPHRQAEVKRDGVACMYERGIYIVTQALEAALLAIKGGYHVCQKKNCLPMNVKYTD